MEDDFIHKLILPAFLFRFIKRREKPIPLSDFDAALLVAIQHAPRYGLPLKQQQLADVLHSDPVTVSEKITRLAGLGLCEIEKISNERGNFPTVTEKGEQKLCQYAQWKYGDVKMFFQKLSWLPGYQKVMKRVERTIEYNLATQFNEIYPQKSSSKRSFKRRE